MRAAVFHRPKKVTTDSVPDPKLESATDCILRVTSTAICGSDLHIYNGLFPQLRPLVLGHEFMGIVEEVGPEVKNLAKGDRVVVPFPIACGACFFCTHGQHTHCENSNRRNYGPEGGIITQKGAGIFGYTDLYGGYQGGQAEYVRVPYADVGPRKVPPALDDEQVLFLSDIFPTGYAAIDWAGLKGGETVAVFGCGPVGIMAMKSAWLKGAGRVLALDIEGYRLERARGAGRAEIIDMTDGTYVEQLRALTGGRGPDVCVDAVGMEAHHGVLEKLSNAMRAQVGSLNAFRACLRSVRRGGAISVVGVYGVAHDNFPWGQMFEKGVQVRLGQVPVHAYLDELIAHVAAGRVKLEDVISHRLPLDKAGDAYELFNAKKDGCVKVVLKP